MSSASTQVLSLLHHPFHAGSRYVRLILGEYGQGADFVEEPFWRRRPEFLAQNPAGSVPVITEAGAEPICGAVPIGEFLDETRGALMREKRLMPDNPHNRAEVRRLVEWFLVKMDQEVLAYLAGERIFKLLQSREGGGSSPEANIIRAGRNNLKIHMRYVAHLAASRDWLGGTHISHADMAAAAAFSILDYLGEVDWATEPALKDWYMRMKSRPTFRAILSDKVAGLAPVSHYIDLDF